VHSGLRHHCGAWLVDDPICEAKSSWRDKRPAQGPRSSKAVDNDIDYPGYTHFSVLFIVQCGSSLYSVSFSFDMHILTLLLPK
jgi:hypothetical protein